MAAEEEGRHCWGQKSVDYTAAQYCVLLVRADRSTTTGHLLITAEWRLGAWGAGRLCGPASQPHHDVRRAVFGTLVCAVNVFPASPPQLLWYHCPLFTPCRLRAAARSPQLHSLPRSECLVIVQIVVFILLIPDSNSSHHEIYIMARRQCFCANNSSWSTLCFTVASLLFF